MQEPRPMRPLTPRKQSDAAHMAVAVQANLVALKVAWSRRAGIASEEHAIRIPPPGAVRRFRETLLPRETIAAYDNAELALRTRQAWGEYGVFCWLFFVHEHTQPPYFAELAPDHAFRTVKELLAKEVRVARDLWRIHHEQRMRFDRDARKDPAFQADHEIAGAMRLQLNGVDIRMARDEGLIEAACEHAGMLGTLRWLIDDSRGWNEPGIMELHDLAPAADNGTDADAESGESA